MNMASSYSRVWAETDVTFYYYMTISLITPVWNNAASIKHCLDSIAFQTVKCQHIVVDGASNDGTMNVLSRYKSAGATVISEADKGMYDAINKGLQKVTGDIIGVLNSDDFYTDNTVLRDVLDAFENPATEACYGDLLYVDRRDTSKVTRTWKSGPYDQKKFYAGWMPPHPAFFLRKSLYDRYGGYRLDLGSAADYELMLRMLLNHNAKTVYVPRVLVHMRNEGMSNASYTSRIRANLNDRKAWRVNNLRPRPWTLLAKPLRKLGQWLPGDRN